MSKLGFVKNTLYDLKKQYGRPIALYKTTTTNDLQTGKRTVTRIKYPIRKGILLPESYITTKIYSLSYIAANKNFTYGALFNRKVKIILIDQSDIRGIRIEPEDYIVLDNRRYDIKNIEDLEFNTGYIIIGEQIEGVTVGAIHNISINHFIRFAHGITHD